VLSLRALGDLRAARPEPSFNTYTMCYYDGRAPPLTRLMRQPKMRMISLEAIGFATGFDGCG